MTVFRQAERPGTPFRGLRVKASGGFDPDSRQSTGIEYTVDVDSLASPGEVEALPATADAVGGIPKAIRAGATIRRAGE